MYETATTLQFRKAVRKVAAKRDLLIYDSHTNRSTIPGRRTVGFSMQGATPELAAKIEKKLNRKGLPQRHAKPIANARVAEVAVVTSAVPAHFHKVVDMLHPLQYNKHIATRSK